MPKKPIDYSNTIIYKIVCNDLNIKDCYVGHTTDFRKRKNQHKSKCNRNIDYKIYNFINQNGGWDNWDMVMIEKYSCKDVLEARARERYWLETFGATLNGCVPNRTINEWIIDNKNYYKDYGIKNIDKIKEKRNKICSCDCGDSYTCRNKARHEKSQKHQNWLKHQTENDTNDKPTAV